MAITAGKGDGAVGLLLVAAFSGATPAAQGAADAGEARPGGTEDSHMSATGTRAAGGDAQPDRGSVRPGEARSIAQGGLITPPDS